MKILAVQNRMGIGDTVIFLPFIKAVSEKFNTPISLLVKESSKADHFLNQTNYIDKILLLEKNNKYGSLLQNFNLIKNNRQITLGNIGASLGHRGHKRFLEFNV